MANWLRTSIYRAVKRPESWNPQTPVQQLNLEHAALRTASRADPRFYYGATALESKYDKQGLAQAWGVESYELFIHPRSLSSYLGRQPAIPEHLLEQKCEDTAYLRAVIDRCRALETRAMQPIDNLFEEAPRMRGGCADDPFYYEKNYPTPKQPTLPKGAPRPGSPPGVGRGLGAIETAEDLGTVVGRRPGGGTHLASTQATLSANAQGRASLCQGARSPAKGGKCRQGQGP